MMMLRTAAVVLLVAPLLTGCEPGAYYEGSAEPEEVTQVASRFEVGAAEPGDVAKTIDWPEGSTSEGDNLLDGALRVDRILRSDGGRLFGVRVRLQNLVEQPVSFDWRMVFLDSQGETVLASGFAGPEVWKSVVIEPLAWVTVTSTALYRGAVRFRLEVRPHQAAPETPAP